jgi:hypothetical protein
LDYCCCWVEQTIFRAYIKLKCCNDVKNKIKYFKAVKDAILKTKLREEFKKILNKKFKNYNGTNYLDMTAGFLFNN